MNANNSNPDYGPTNNGETVAPCTMPTPSPDGELGQYSDGPLEPPNGAHNVFDEHEEERVELHAECDGLWGLCRRRTDADERREGLRAGDLSAWRANPWGSGAVGPCRRRRPPDPLPLKAGLRTPLARLARRLDTQEGRLWVAVRLAEALVLPRLSAADAEERDGVNRLLAHALRLDEAVACGLLSGYVTCWQGGRWPRRPASLRLRWPAGRAQADRIIGEHAPTLELLVADLTQRPMTHMLNGRVIDRPPLPLPPTRRW